MLRAMVADFTKQEVEPQAEQFDREQRLNLDLFRRLADLGLLGITVPEEEGGAGMDAVAAVIVHHELSKSDPGFCLAYLAHAMLFVNNFYWCVERRAARALSPQGPDRRVGRGHGHDRARPRHRRARHEDDRRQERATVIY